MTRIHNFILLLFILSIQFFILPLANLSNKTNIFNKNNVSSKKINNNIPNIKNKKRKILIFMCKGGAGHISVSNALKEYLEKDYEISIANIIGDILAPVDPLKSLTFGKVSGEEFYNFCLQCKWTGFVNKYAKIGAWGVKWKEKEIIDLISNFVKKDMPDLIISVVPLVNNAILKVAENFKLPLMVVTNDLDTTNYINGISGPKYNKFYYTLSFDEPELWKKIESAKIPKTQVKVTGFPLRPQFYKNKFDTKLIKKDFAIPENKKVIMLFMGGAGSLSTYRYMRAMMRYNRPIHIIVCLGKNENLRRTIERMNLPKHITISIVGFTDRISDLMSISDILITKPGPGSICEGIAANLPMLIDRTNGTLWWENMNIDLVTKYNFGDLVTSYRDLNRLIDKYLLDQNYVTSIKRKMQEFNKKTSFSRCIKTLIEEVLKSEDLENTKILSKKH